MNQIPNCSFCGKSQSEVGDFLHGTVDGFICFDCIEHSSVLPASTDATASCGFCGRKRNEVPKLMTGHQAHICNVCIEIASNPSVLTQSGFVLNPGTRIGNWLLSSENRFIKKHIIGIKP